MDFFSYCLEDRGLLVVDDMEFPVNSFGRINNFVKDFALKDIHDLDKTMFILDGGEAVTETESVESIFRHNIGEFHLDNPCLRVDHSVIKVPSTSMSNLDQFTGDLGFGSELLDSCYNSIDKKESLIDSENPTDFIQVCSRVSSEGSIVSSLVQDSLPAKRAQRADFQFQVLHCQVQGCYKDLSSSKDYHKRHRVCDVHSKSVKAVINGIENRFCQQCSRFHLLKEFDDVKRSCRKRLAGHNKRRRRPQLGVDSGALQMGLLESGSFLLTDERPADFYYQEKHVDGNQSKCIRLENVPGDTSQLTVVKCDLLEYLLYVWKETAKHHAFQIFVGIGAGKVEFAMPLDYGCAPSLLSFESKTLSSYSPGSSEVLNPVIGGKYPAYETSDNKCFYHPPMLYDGSTDVCSNVQICGLSQSSESMLNYCHFPEAGSTLDLMNLSSHLRRVEQQQNSMQVRQETFSFSCSTSH